MPEYSNISGAYKFLKINNVKLIFHSFLNAFNANDSSFPIACNYDGSAIAGTPPTHVTTAVSATNANFVLSINANMPTSTFPGLNTMLSVAKSKLISTTPDSFACDV